MSISNTRHFDFIGQAGSLEYPGRIKPGLAVSVSRARIAMFVVATVAFGLSSYLSWAAMTSSKVAGCGGGSVFDCSHVMQSKWSMAFGIPVGIPAAGLYLAVLGSLIAMTFSKRDQGISESAKSVLTVCALAAAFAAIWFISLQVFVVEHLCTYCLAAHSCGLILAGLVLWSLQMSRSKTAALAALAVAGVAIMATGQLMAEAPKTYQIENHGAAFTQDEENTEIYGENIFLAPGFESDQSGTDSESDDTIFAAPIEAGNEPGAPTSENQLSGFQLSTLNLLSWNIGLISVPTQQEQVQSNELTETNNQTGSHQEKERLVAINGGKTRLNVGHWPVVGSASAEQIFVEMFDYTCPHCRENHKSVKAAMDQLGKDRVAFLALAVPMNSNCNGTVRVNDAKHAEACELAKISVAVWRVAPEKFGEFHEWMFAGDTAPTAATALGKAKSLFEDDKLQARIQLEFDGNVVGQYIAKQVELYKSIGAGTVPKLLFPNITVSGKVDSANALVQIINKQSISNAREHK